MPTITVYREDRELTGKALSSNTLASFLIAQGVSSVADLTTESSMQTELLRFLNRDRALRYWCQEGLLVREASGYRLTNGGLDEILSREAGVAVNGQGRKKPGNVSPDLVRIARQFILTGQPVADVPVLTQQFHTVATAS